MLIVMLFMLQPASKQRCKSVYRAAVSYTACMFCVCAVRIACEGMLFVYAVCLFARVCVPADVRTKPTMDGYVLTSMIIRTGKTPQCLQGKAE